MSTDQYEYEERAAIMEYCGGMSRTDAERAAADDLEAVRVRGEQLEMEDTK